MGKFLLELYFLSPLNFLLVVVSLVHPYTVYPCFTVLSTDVGLSYLQMLFSAKANFSKF